MYYFVYEQNTVQQTAQFDIWFPVVKSDEIMCYHQFGPTAMERQGWETSLKLQLIYLHLYSSYRDFKNENPEIFSRTKFFHIFCKCYPMIYSNSLPLTLAYKTVYSLESCRRDSSAFRPRSPPVALKLRRAHLRQLEPASCLCPVPGSCKQRMGRGIVCGALQARSSVPPSPVTVFSRAVVLCSTWKFYVSYGHWCE